MERKNNPANESELESLRRRLTEAEDTLDAIRAGEVDAVVVDGPVAQQVYTLESPDQPFRMFVEQMQEGALTLSGDGTIIYCNRFFADLVGLPVEQVRGEVMDRFIATGEEDFRQLLTTTVDGVVHSESSLLSVDGRSIWVQLALNPLPAEDSDTFGMVVTDLTEQVRAQKLEAQHLAAQEATAARDQFLAIVSHELRTPLNAILGWTQILNRQQEVSEAVKRGLEVIERSAWTQAQLIDDLLDVSRVLAGKLRLDLNPVKLARIIEAGVNSVQPSANDRGVEIRTDLSGGELVVRGDADRLQQIITNLLSNAVKFTPQKGEVRVSLHEVDGHAQLKVSDTGAGIPKEFVPHLFELYKQIEGTTARRSGGLGLGLAIVKELTDLHGGEITAESEGEGQGATFTLRLPLYQTDEQEQDVEQNAESASPRDLTGIRILLVEDDQATRDVLVQVLSECGGRVVSAATANEALVELENHPIDVMVSDIGLPGMDGYQLISKVRASGRSGRELPAIAVTAFAGRDDRRRALLAGYQVHLSKPVDHSELNAVIANLAGIVEHD